MRLGLSSAKMKIWVLLDISMTVRNEQNVCAHKVKDKVIDLMCKCKVILRSLALIADIIPELIECGSLFGQDVGYILIHAGCKKCDISHIETAGI